MTRTTTILNVVHDPGLEALIRVRGYSWLDVTFEKAAERGTRIHEMVRMLHQGEIDDDVETGLRVNPYYREYTAYKRWYDTTVAEVISSEVKMVDDKHGYSGHPDLVCKTNDGAIALVDLKTGSVVNEKHRLQLGAYWNLVKGNLGIKPTQLYIIQVYQGKLKVHQFQNCAYYFSQFLCALSLYKQIYKETEK